MKLGSKTHYRGQRVVSHGMSGSLVCIWYAGRMIRVRPERLRRKVRSDKGVSRK